jgi:hypothetical protein
MTRIGKVTKPRVIGLERPSEKLPGEKSFPDPWNPPELVGKSKGEVHERALHGSGEGQAQE